MIETQGEGVGGPRIYKWNRKYNKEMMFYDYLSANEVFFKYFLILIYYNRFVKIQTIVYIRWKFIDHLNLSFDKRLFHINNTLINPGRKIYNSGITYK